MQHVLLRRLVLACLAFAAPARADLSWRAGLDVHGTDAAFAARRPVGIASGLRYGAVEGSVVVDPMMLILGWEMLDVTAGRWIADDRIELLGGWRQVSGRLSGGRRYDEGLLLGVDSVGVSSGRFRIAFGAEVTTSVWRHGARIPGDSIQLILNMELATRIELLLHVRFEITGGR
jgi:hypothetical protein